MHRRFCKSLLPWIVPLLVLRALIPAGFMLHADTEGLRLVFCSGTAGGAVPSTEHAGHHAGHDGSPAGEPSGEHSGDHAKAGHYDSPCPFALAAVTAAGEVPHLAAAAASPVDEPFEFLSAPSCSAGPPRSDRIRGPPSLA